MTACYRFRVAGRLSSDLVDSFGPTHWHLDEHWHKHQQSTVLVVEIRDQTELFGVLGRCETLRLDLLELEVLDDREDPGDRANQT